MYEDNVVLYLYDLPNKSIQEILDHKEKYMDDIGGLSWSPDGSKLAFFF